MGGRKWVIAGIVVAVLSAAPPAGAETTYYACTNNSDGTIRMVAAGTECRKNETLISWNQVGPIGPMGPAGPQGPEGPPGPSSDLRIFYPEANIISTLDSAGDVGYFTSVAISADGLPLISYYDVTNSDLKVAHCNDVACSAASTSTLDSAGYVGLYTSVTIGADGLPLISYYDYTNGDLKVAHCADTSCVNYRWRR